MIENIPFGQIFWADRGPGCPSRCWLTFCRRIWNWHPIWQHAPSPPPWNTRKTFVNIQQHTSFQMAEHFYSRPSLNLIRELISLDYTRLIAAEHAFKIKADARLCGRFVSVDVIGSCIAERMNAPLLLNRRHNNSSIQVTLSVHLRAEFTFISSFKRQVLNNRKRWLRTESCGEAIFSTPPRSSSICATREGYLPLASKTSRSTACA